MRETTTAISESATTLPLKPDLESLDAATPVAAHGAALPLLGFGTWELVEDDAVRMVETALEIGYRHLDTAQAYGNEAAVGRGLAAAGLPRDEIWVTTKVWPEHYAQRVFLDTVRRSLERLRLDAVDLLLLHWPRFVDNDLEATVGLLEEARERGFARHVGVSNFPTELLDHAVKAAERPLAVNQVEYHPFLDQRKVLAAVREHGMALTAYSPLARGDVESSEMITRIGARHGKSEEQIALRWLVQQERVTAIPKTTDPDHCRQNFQIFDFVLSAEEMHEIAGLARPDGRIVDPEDLAPDWD